MDEKGKERYREAQHMQDKKEAEIAAVTTVVATTPAPLRKEPVKEKGPGLLQRIAGFFTSSTDAEDEGRQQKRTRQSADSRRRGGPRGRKSADGQRQPTCPRVRTQWPNWRPRSFRAGHSPVAGIRSEKSNSKSRISAMTIDRRVVKPQINAAVAAGAGDGAAPIRRMPLMQPRTRQ